MFTGIIEEVGSIERIKQTGNAILMTIASKKLLEDVKLGDSIAINGVCLTVTSFDKGSFTVDVMPETVKATSLKQLSRGSNVNLERAMAAGGRFGGHFVSGHVDGIGEVIKKQKQDNAIYYEIEVSEALRNYIIMKGSIAIDGTSLTVFGVTDTTFTISIIPHTISETIIGAKGTGDIVNIECDMVGKYIEQFIERRFESKTQKSTLSTTFLEEHGFK